MPDDRNRENTQGERPSDTEELVGDTAASRKLNDDDRIEPDDSAKRDGSESEEEANPPRTTKGWFTAPKFGSAGSGGAELEPGPKKN